MRSPRPSPRDARYGALLLLALAAPLPAAPQGAPGGAPAPIASSGVEAELEALRSTAESDASLSEEARARLVELVTRAIAERRRAAELRAETTALAARIAAAPQRIAALKAALETPPPQPDHAAWSKANVDELTVAAREKQQALETAREALKSSEKELAALAALSARLGDEIASRKSALRDLAAEGAAAPTDEPPVAAAVRQVWLAAREARLNAGIALAELQLANYEPLVRLATLERDVAALQVPRVDAERELLATAVEAKRAEEARAGRQDAQQTRAAAAGLPDAVAALATENAELRRELEQVTATSGRIAERLRASERRESELESDMVSIRERVESVGPTEAIGRLLRRRLYSLQGVDTDRLQAFGRANEIVRATDRRIDLGEQRRELAATQAQVDAVLASVPDAERAALGESALRARTAELVAAKRATIEELHEAYGRLLTQLTSYDAVERQLAATAAAMREFIRRELLWIRSMPPIAASDLAAAPGAIAPLLRAENWLRVFDDATQTTTAQPVRTTLALLIVLALLAVRPLARRHLARLGELTSRIRTDAFRHTLFALALTLVISLAWPTVLYFAGWLIAAADQPAPFSTHISVTLRRLARLMLIFSTARWLIHYNGLARLHFRWPEPVRVMLRREFRWLTVIGIVCVVFGVFGNVQGSPETRLALGRPAVIAFAASLALFFWRIYRRDGPLMEAARRRHPASLRVRAWWLWYPALVALPASNVFISAAGYADAAVTATVLVIDSGWLLLGVWVLRDTILRGFTVEERRLRFERALQQREEARVEREKQRAAGSEEEPVSDAADVDVPQVDFQHLGEQARSVVQVTMGFGLVVALWILWSDLLPALTAVDHLQLPMSRVELVDGVEQRVSVTVIDVLVALLALAGTLFAAKNLSGLLGFTVLRRIGADPGAQYAIVTLCQYVLVAGGVLYAFSAVGVQWSKLQWLVAALGVGLGFGLQEIVANFVSGIILLLERPIRVGDVVTVGDATGRVSRIRIRATTIVDFDRKELVVPNKEFVTGRLLNWTLSNEVLRLVIPVGVAYGSDVRRARALLLEAAEENENVLADPAPITMFNNFGDNALGLELRVYLPSIEYLLSTQTELHDAIYEKLDRAGIVIAFPQRDVHLDTGAPLDIRVHRADDAAKAPRRPWRRGRD